MMPKPPTRPPAIKRTASPSLKASRDLAGSADQKNVTLPRISASSPRASSETEGDDETQRVQGAELQHCESILSTIQKETTQNGNRYITMLEFKETSEPVLDNMKDFVKSMRKELGDLEQLCAQGWDTDDIDDMLASIPAKDVSVFKHLWSD
ncbi:hypothetical protein AC1031_003908 [Aphanomyces cochlioides]|nr:hypothetical protein AC1031_003908 [Aphanomyces cochlioides]